MTTNISTIKDWDTCRRKVLHSHHFRKATSRTLPLAIGTAFHAAVGIGLARHDWDAAIAHANAHSAAEIRDTLEDFELYKLDEYVHVTVAMVRAYQQAYEPIAAEWHVIQPEAQFCVEIPDSFHNCLQAHHLVDGVEHFGMPTGDAIARGAVTLIHQDPDPTCWCWQPHRLAGRTDAVVVNNNRLWLFEHKTTSSLSNPWWMQWTVDKQPTAYLYGLWRTTGQLPAGFVLNAVRKPTDDQVQAWNRLRKSGQPKSIADYIQFEKRSFPRTHADLLRFERQMRHTLDEWERAMLGGMDYFDQQMVSGNCTKFNHVCEWMPACVEAETAPYVHIIETSYLPRDRNYVDEYIDAIVMKERPETCYGN